MATSISRPERLRLDGIPEGVYDVRIRATSRLPAMIRGVTIRAGKVVDLGEVCLAAGGVLEVTVTDETGSPPEARTWVTAVRPGVRFARTRVRENGVVRITALPPGRLPRPGRLGRPGRRTSCPPPRRGRDRKDGEPDSRGPHRAAGNAPDPGARRARPTGPGCPGGGPGTGARALRPPPRERIPRVRLVERSPRPPGASVGGGGSSHRRRRSARGGATPGGEVPRDRDRAPRRGRDRGGGDRRGEHQRGAVGGGRREPGEGTSSRR